MDKKCPKCGVECYGESCGDPSWFYDFECEECGFEFHYDDYRSLFYDGACNEILDFLSIIEAMGNTIVVKELDVGITSSVIAIPDEVRDNTDACRGKVVSVGPDYKYNVKVGDVVIYRRNECTKIDCDGDEYKSLKGKWVEAVEG